MIRNEHDREMLQQMLKVDDIPEPVERLYERFQECRGRLNLAGSVSPDTLALIAALGGATKAVPKVKGAAA